MSSLPSKFRFKMLVIGCSAGGVEQLSRLFAALPADFPVPIAVVLHLAANAGDQVADTLGFDKKLKVKYAEDKEPAAAGTIYLAPPDYHLLLELDGSFSLSSEEPVLFSRPSIDVFFESASYAYGFNLLGMILSGANGDGSLGLKAIVDSLGYGVVQDPTDATFPTMPAEAIKIAKPQSVMSLSQIIEWVQKP